MKLQRADWRSATYFLALLVALVIAWRTKIWVYGANMAFVSPGPETVSIGVTLAFLAIALAYAQKLKRIGTPPPLRRISLGLAGPLDIFIEQIGYGAMVYACLRGMRLIFSPTMDIPILDKISVAAALNLLLYWAVAQPLKDLKDVLTLKNAVPITPGNVPQP